MDLTKTGQLIAGLRREKGLTQSQVAERLGVLAQTVSKWETGRGFPDVSLVAALSDVLEVDISKLLEGELPQIKRSEGNVKKTRFYVCEKCGNILMSERDAEIFCCGRKLLPLTPKAPDNEHLLKVEKIEDDFYITFPHPMTKEHCFTLAAYVRFDRVLSIRLYPEQGGEIRMPQMRGGKLYLLCSKDGLFEYKI